MMDVTTELTTELDSVTGDRCGWTCHHHADTFPPCQRAKDHAGATQIVDVHLARRDDDGMLITATADCCA